MIHLLVARHSQYYPLTLSRRLKHQQLLVIMESVIVMVEIRETRRTVSRNLRLQQQPNPRQLRTSSVLTTLTSL